MILSPRPLSPSPRYCAIIYLCPELISGEPKTDIPKLKIKLIQALTQAVTQAQEADKLPAMTLPEVTVEHPQKAEHGDYASSIAMKLARSVGTNPIAIAKIIVTYIEPIEEVEKVDVAPPGFINFTFKTDWLNS